MASVRNQVALLDAQHPVPLRVLLVEDSEEDAALVLHLLRRGGYDPACERVETAAAMRAALARESWDIVISDYALPRFSGPAALALLQERGIDLPFIVVSGSIGEDVAVASMKAGAHDYVMKANLARLVPAIDRELREAEVRRERKRADEALRASEELFRSLVTSADDSIIVTGAEANIRFVNESGMALHGTDDPAELIGVNLFNLLAEESRASARQDMRIASTGGVARNRQHLLVRRDGTRVPIEMTVSGLRDASGTLSGFLAITRDITERKALEDQLRHSHKMEAVGRLAGGMAHDFNNQLTVIKGCAQFLLAALPTDNPSRRDAERISATVERGACLVRQLLAFSRRQAIATCSVNLTQLVSDTATMLRILLGEQTDLQLRLAPDVWTVRADPAQIEQVLMNLVANAKDAFLAAGSHGGALVVETTNVEVAEGGLSCGPWERLRPGQYVMLVVNDTGCGMTAEVRERIFEPFFTTKEPGKGTGLGLSTAYGIVKQHGGHVACESELGRGTAFRIYLPRDDGNQRATARPIGAAAVPGQPTRSRTTVLVAEDEEGVREVVREALEKAGHAVRVAAGIEQALAVAHQGSIQLLVTDLVMPDGSGLTLARRLAQTHPTMRTLFMSGYSEEIVAGHELSEANFLRKPFGVDDLLRKAHALLHT